MELSTGFLLYAAVFRLAVIGVGVVAIVLGYLLFVRGTVAHGKTDAGLEFAEFKLNLKSAAPGTCFAAFGAVIIIVMLADGNPELVLETARNAAMPGEASASAVRMKGDGGAVALPGLPDGLAGEPGGGLGGHLAVAARAVREGDTGAAMAAYSAALGTPGLSTAQTALALGPMARIALMRGNQEQAETLARLAVLFSGGAPEALDALARTLIVRARPGEAVDLARGAAEARPDEARYLHTLALGLAAAGEREEAGRVLDQAARIDAVYAAERSRLLGEAP